MITHESSLKEFDKQISHVLNNYTDHGFRAANFNNVIMGGLGGSGIGALIAKSWLFDKVELPIEVINDYSIPSYVNEKTLVVLNSYSGNTEETINLFNEASSKGATIVTLCSGGKLKVLADEKSIPCYPIETGFQPRQTIGMGLGYLLLILGDFFGIDYREELNAVREKLIENQEKQMISAERMYDYYSSSISNKFVILADRPMYPLAVRFAQQLNENAKLEAFVHPVPECNHNVLESYTDRLQTNFMLLYTEENLRVGSRFDFIAGHLEMDNNKVLPLGIVDYDLYTVFDVTYRLDWFSVIAANELEANSMEVPVLTALKEYMSQVEEVVNDEEE